MKKKHQRNKDLEELTAALKLGFDVILPPGTVVKIKPFGSNKQARIRTIDSAVELHTYICTKGSYGRLTYCSYSIKSFVWKDSVHKNSIIEVIALPEGTIWWDLPIWSKDAP